MSQPLTRQQLCAIHGITERTFGRWKKRESFPTPVRLEGRIGYWDRREFAEWMNAHCELTTAYGRWRLKTEQPAEVG